MRRAFIAIGAAVMFTLGAQADVRQQKETQVNEELRKALSHLKKRGPTPELREASENYRKAFDAAEAAAETAKRMAQPKYNCYSEPNRAAICAYKLPDRAMTLKVFNAAYAASNDAEAKVSEVLLAVHNLPLEYKQPAFQCLDDYEHCRAKQNYMIVCSGFLFVCLAERVIPLAGG